MTLSSSCGRHSDWWRLQKHHLLTRCLNSNINQQSEGIKQLFHWSARFEHRFLKQKDFTKVFHLTIVWQFLLRSKADIKGKTSLNIFIIRVSDLHRNTTPNPSLPRKKLHREQYLMPQNCPLSSCDLGKPLGLSLSVLVCKLELVHQQLPLWCFLWVKFTKDGKCYHFSSAYHVLGTLPTWPQSVRSKTLLSRHWNCSLESYQHSEWKSQDSNPSLLTPNHCFFHSASYPGSCKRKGFENCEGLRMWLLLCL